jgi:acetolactate synthase small subunit
VLLKIRAPPGPTRTEVMQLIDIFRARVVDVSDRSLTIAVTGDAGKVRPLLLPPRKAPAAACTAGVNTSRMTGHGAPAPA